MDWQIERDLNQVPLQQFFPHFMPFQYEELPNRSDLYKSAYNDMASIVKTLENLAKKQEICRLL